MTPKTIDFLSLVIPCFATPTLNFLQVQYRGSNFNHADNMKEKS